MMTPITCLICARRKRRFGQVGVTFGGVVVLGGNLMVVEFGKVWDIRRLVNRAQLNRFHELAHFSCHIVPAVSQMSWEFQFEHCQCFVTQPPNPKQFQ